MLAPAYPGLFTRLADAAPVLIWIAGPDAGCIWFNRRWLAFTGRTLEQEAGDGWTESVHPDDLTACVGTYRQAFAARAEFEMEYRLRRHDGEYRWVIDRGVPWHTETGFAGYVGSAVDVTGVKRAEAKADEQGRKLRAISDAVPVLISYVDATERYRFNNRAYEQWFGHTRDEITGHHVRDVLGDAAYDTVRPLIARALQGEHLGFEALVPYKDGGTRFVQAAYVPDRAPDGQVTGYIGTITDITALKHAEHLATERAAELEHLNQLKDEFLATLSHELRTPLNAILGWARIVRSSEIEPDRIRRALEVIERNAVAQERLIADLLDMSAVMAGKLQINPAEVDLAAAVRQSLDALQLAAEVKQLSLTVEVPPNLGTVTADPTRLQQILWNVLSNAVKFTPDRGQVAVRAQREGSLIRCRIEDSGIGIAPEFLPHLFERFRQADSSPTRQHSGLGLGLALAKQLAELQGGSLEASSPGVGQGTTFVLTLPLRAVKDESDGPARSATPAPRAIPGPPADPLSGSRILVVDDHDDARRLLGVVLRRSGANVSEAGSVGQGLDAVRRARPELVITDIGLPGEDGYALLREIRALVPELPVVAITGFGSQTERERARAAGFNAFLVKPVEPSRLRQTVTDVLRAAL
jgi:PAS domain S-box-containing protein